MNFFALLRSLSASAELRGVLGDFRNLPLLFGVLCRDCIDDDLRFLVDFDLPGVFLPDTDTLFLDEEAREDGRGFLVLEPDINEGERADESGLKKELIWD